MYFQDKESPSIMWFRRKVWNKLRCKRGIIKRSPPSFSSFLYNFLSVVHTKDYDLGLIWKKNLVLQKAVRHNVHVHTYSKPITLSGCKISYK